MIIVDQAAGKGARLNPNPNLKRGYVRARGGVTVRARGGVTGEGVELKSKVQSPRAILHRVEGVEVGTLTQLNSTQLKVQTQNINREL